MSVNIIDHVGEHTVDAVSIEDRIGELKEWRDSYEEEGDPMPEDEMRELAELVDYRAAVVKAASAGQLEDVAVVPEKLLGDYVRKQVTEYYGLNDEDDPYDLRMHLDWEGLAEAHQRRFARVEVAGGVFWAGIE